MRSMNAEIEVKRLKSEVNENMAARNELVNQIRKLEVASQTADQLTVEKAELVIFISSLCNSFPALKTSSYECVSRKISTCFER